MPVYKYIPTLPGAHQKHIDYIKRNLNRLQQIKKNDEKIKGIFMNSLAVVSIFFSHFLSRIIFQEDIFNCSRSFSIIVTYSKSMLRQCSIYL